MKRQIGQLLIRWGKWASRRNDYPFLRRHLLEIPPDGVVLNIGSGGGFDEIVREVAQIRGYRVTSSDIDPSRKPDLVDDICASGLPTGSMDAIVMASVIEHVPQPFEAAREIERILKPGGSALFIIPFMFPIHDRPHDYFRFTEYGVKLLFRDLEIVEMEPRDNWAEALLLGAARIAYEPRKAWLALFVVPMCAVLFPLASMFHRGSGHITSGYMMKAVKPRTGIPAPGL